MVTVSHQRSSLLAQILHRSKVTALSGHQQGAQSTPVMLD
jgi:hypothetical protein